MKKIFLILAAAVVLSSCATAKGKSKAETQGKGGFGLDKKEFARLYYR